MENNISEDTLRATLFNWFRWDRLVKEVDELDDESLKNLYRFAVLMNSDVELLKTKLSERGLAVPVLVSSLAPRTKVEELRTSSFMKKLFDLTGVSIGGAAEMFAEYMGGPVWSGAKRIENLLDDWSRDKNDGVSPQKINVCLKCLEQLANSMGYTVELHLVEKP